ncbi:uncharacterized protein [Rutidosis leptorrhynchoides]|uniref:uncharacterized protein n=1 Tax=Rutidosis leptorrhynchoides TaxID=125765 RepID=UPI003A9991E1
MKIISLNIRGFAKEGAYGWVRSLCGEEKPDIFAFQETKSSRVSEQWASCLWWSNRVGIVQKEAMGYSGGLMILWDLDSFEVKNYVESEFYIAIKGRWKTRNCDYIIVNIYGPQDDASKIRMWDSLSALLGSIDSSWLLCGDFNEVREENERLNSIFIPSRAKRFNDFISDNSLVEIPLGGRKFTRVCDNGVKLSKLDRFIASDNFLNQWDDLSALVLDRKFSHHCPIVIRDKVLDFGPRPFKIFDKWLNHEEVDELIKKAWDVEVSGYRKDCVFRNKLKNVKSALREWSRSNMSSLEKDVIELKEKVKAWESKAEVSSLSEHDRKLWMDCRKT